MLRNLTTSFADSNLSAFGDLISVPLTPLVQLDFVHGINSQTGSVGTPLNSATGDTNSGRLRLQTGTNSAGAVAFTSLKPARYRPGQGIVARFSYAFTTGVANSSQWAGMSNYTSSASNTAFIDGYLFGYSGTGFGILHRNNSSDSFIAQASWNQDTCNGSGASGFTLDPTKGNVFMIVFPYLGYGDIKFFIEDSTTGRWILAHIIRYANTSASTQVSNPSLSFYALAINSGNTTNLIGYCGSVGLFLSGVRHYLGAIFGIGNRKAAITTRTNVFSIKVATTYNTVLVRGVIRLKSVSVAWDAGNDTALFDIVKNTTLGGTPVWNGVSGTVTDTATGAAITSGQSAVSIDTAGTTVTGGVIQYNSTMSRNTAHQIDLTDYDLFLTSGETFTFAVTGDSSGAARVSVNWVEDI